MSSEVETAKKPTETDVETGDSVFPRPTLYEEVREMLEHSIMVYNLAEYRLWGSGAAAADDDDDDDKADSTVNKWKPLPMTVADITELTKIHAAKMVEMYPKDGDRRMEIIYQIMEAMATGEENCAEKGQVLVFDDARQDTELVYSISLEPARKRVVVVFRGSVTKEDWKADIRAWQSKVPLEKDVLPGFKFVTLHKGFYDYLFAKTAETGNTKFATILGQVQVLLNDHPGYQLYVTGHSLGGALCTLFSVFASQDKTLPKPVSCFTYGSPKVGTHSFLRLMQKAETDGVLRYVRTANNFDPVTNVPKDFFLLCQTDIVCGLICNTIGQRIQYRHGGMELRVYNPDEKGCCHGTTIQIGHLPDSRFGFFPLLLSDMNKLWKRAVFMIINFFKYLLCMGVNFRTYHSWVQYYGWLETNKEELSGLYLDDLYKAVEEGDFSVVGRRY